MKHMKRRMKIIIITCLIAMLCVPPAYANVNTKHGRIGTKYYLAINNNFMTVNMNDTDRNHLIAKVMKNKGWTEARAKRTVIAWETGTIGLCGGFSASVLLNHTGKANAKRVLGFNIHVGETNNAATDFKRLRRIQSYCAYYQIVVTQLAKRKRFSNTKKGVLYAVKQLKKKKRPQLLDANFQDIGQHVILLCSMKKTTKKYYYVYVYDSNAPTSKTVLRVKKKGKGKGAAVLMNNDYGNSKIKNGVSVINYKSVCKYAY